MSNGYEYDPEPLDAYSEYYEGDDGIEATRRVHHRGRRDHRRREPARPPGQYRLASAPDRVVTTGTLSRTLSDVRRDMVQNAAAARDLRDDLDTYHARTRGQIAAQRSQSQNALQMLTLLPLLVRPPSLPPHHGPRRGHRPVGRHPRQYAAQRRRH